MNRTTTALILIIVFAAALRLAGLGDKALWLDEVITVRRVRHDPLQMIREIAQHDAHPPLFYLLQYLVKPFGIGEGPVRFPAALAGIAAVLATWLAGKRLAGSSAGLMGAAMAAVSAFLIYFSQEARNYSLATLLALLSLWLFLTLIKHYDDDEESARHPWKLWCGYVAVGVAMLYTYYYLLFVLIAQAVVLLASHRNARRMLLPWLISQGVIALAFLPWLPSVLGHAGHSSGALQSTPQLVASLPQAFVQMLTGIDSTALGLDLTARFALFLVSAGAVGAGAYHLRNNRRSLLAISAYVLVPVFCVILLPWRLQIFEPKHLIFIAPVLMMLVMLPAAHRPCRPLNWLGPFVILMLNIFALSGYYGIEPQKESWPEACAVIAELSGPNDAILFNPFYAGYPFQHYCRDAQLPVIEPQAPGMTEEILLRIMQQRDHIWLVEYHSNVAFPYPPRSLLVAASGYNIPIEYAGETRSQVSLQGTAGTIIISRFVIESEIER